MTGTPQKNHQPGPIQSRQSSITRHPNRPSPSSCQKTIHNPKRQNLKCQEITTGPATSHYQRLNSINCPSRSSPPASRPAKDTSLRRRTPSCPKLKLVILPSGRMYTLSIRISQMGMSKVMAQKKTLQTKWRSRLK